MIKERFAPSPTGYLHLGHAFSALMAWDAAKRSGGEFLLRIEDIDTSRSRAEFESAIYDDLHWLGLRWPNPVMRQSDRMKAYHSALNILFSNDLIYPCNCTRRDIIEALNAPQEGSEAIIGPDGPIYPGTCRNKNPGQKPQNAALRLNMAAVIAHIGPRISKLTFDEIGTEKPETHALNADDLMQTCGDIVLARRDIGTSYHLSVVVDDAFQQISHVTRGRDMFEATKIHRLLQELLGLATPIYRHHKLIRDENGKRLAKRDDARAIRKFRTDGASPTDVRAMIGL